MKLKIAVVGCSHGCLDLIFEKIMQNAQETGKPVDLVLCCGDFQCIRSEQDIQYVARRAKKIELGDFHQYYNSQKTVPALIVFIGGNHEASHVLHDLHYGGWVAPNIFYLGRSGVIILSKGQKHYIRIGGLSGIYKHYNYNKGYFERFPYDSNTSRSVYHIRKFDVELIKQYNQVLDIFMTHDWPQGVTKYGDIDLLLRKKPRFASEVFRHQLGNPITANLWEILKIRFWFAAHLHAKFQANIPVLYENESRLMYFLALDKPLRIYDCIEFIEIEMNTFENDTNFLTGVSQDLRICFDPTWLSLIKENFDIAPFNKYDAFVSVCKQPSEATYNFVLEALKSQSVKLENVDNSILKSPQFYLWPGYSNYKDLVAQKKYIVNTILNCDCNQIDGAQNEIHKNVNYVPRRFDQSEKEHTDPNPLNFQTNFLSDKQHCFEAEEIEIDDMIK